MLNIVRSYDNLRPFPRESIVHVVFIYIDSGIKFFDDIRLKDIGFIDLWFKKLALGAMNGRSPFLTVYGRLSDLSNTGLTRFDTLTF